MPQMYFFATRSDLEPVLQDLESKRRLKYVGSDVYKSSRLDVYQSAFDIPNLGVCLHDDIGIGYDVFDADTEVVLYEGRYPNGAFFCMVDSLKNPTGIGFRPGGHFKNRWLLAGDVSGGGNQNKVSLGLYLQFARAIKKRFAKVEDCYVGPEALRLFDGGLPLVTSPDLRFALKRPAPQAKRAARTLRLPVEETWRFLKQEGYEPPEDTKGQPAILERMPSYDDEGDRLSFFKTRVEGDKLDHLTIPRTFFARSEMVRVGFQDTDLHESRMCWNDWTKCNFTGADLTGCDMRASVFVRCKFVKAVLLGADMRRCTFDRCDFAGAQLAGAQLSRAQAEQLDLSGQQWNDISWQQDDGPEPPGG